MQRVEGGSPCEEGVRAAGSVQRGGQGVGHGRIARVSAPHWKVVAGGDKELQDVDMGSCIDWVSGAIGAETLEEEKQDDSTDYGLEEVTKLGLDLHMASEVVTWAEHMGSKG